MGSRFKGLFSGKGASNVDDHLRGQPYDTAVAADPPVKGTYPVGGNGPNVLEEIQRARSERQSQATSTTGASIAGPAYADAAPAPSVPRYPESEHPRPRTAPHSGEPGGGRQRATKSKNGRSPSDPSTKPPPSFFSTGRRASVGSGHRRNSVITDEPPPPLPTSIPPYPTSIPSYESRSASGGTGRRDEYVTPTAPISEQHHDHDHHSHRTSSAASSSHKAYVDLLDAYSNINRTREASKHRAQASGVRDYGEDVADRNIVEFGHTEETESARESRLDFNSPELSYLKTVYHPTKRHASNNYTRSEREQRLYSRVDSALGHVLGGDGRIGDDIQSPNQSDLSTTSIRSSSGLPGSRLPRLPRSDHVDFYPPQSEHAKRELRYHGTGGRNDDDHARRLNKDRRGGTLPSSSSPNPASGRGEHVLIEDSIEDPIQYQGNIRNSTRQTSSLSTPPPIPDRGRRSASSRASLTPKSPLYPNPVDYSPPADRPPPAASPSQERQRTMSTTTGQKTATPSNSIKALGTSSRESSINHSASAFPPQGKRTSQAAESGRSPAVSNVRRDNDRGGMIVEGAAEAPSLDGVVDLKDSVDTEVITKSLPAVVHEYVTPHRHEIRQESITREIHTHDVYHRILPVIETEILPTKHYIYSKDGKSLIEIPESEVPQHTLTGTYGQNWHIAPGPAPTNTNNDRLDSGYRSSIDSVPEGPVIGLARGEANPASRKRGNSTRSTRSTLSAKEVLHPILSSKKETMTKEGYPKTEYVWRHPPVFETADGETQPALIPAAFEGDRYHTDEDEDTESGAEKLEGDLLFRDTGYGNGGMLPGLPQKAPMAQHPLEKDSRRIPRKEIRSSGYGKDVKKTKDRGSEGEATAYLRRLREKRRSGESTGDGVEGLEHGVRNMNMK